VVRSVKSDRGLEPAQVLWDHYAYDVNCTINKLELAP
jgi:hypothetical protein